MKLLGLFPYILNTSQPNTISIHSRAMFQAAVLLSQQYNITIQGKFIGWQSVQTEGDVMNALSSACLTTSTSNIVGIVGPGFSSESHFIAPFAAKISIPVISYSSTDPELSDRNAYSAFYRTVPSDNLAALAMAQLFVQFNWAACIVIYQNDAFGYGGTNAISKVFYNNNLTVSDTIMFDIMTLTIRGNLKTILTNSATRIIILWTTLNYASIILQNALNADVLGPQFTWILGATVPMDTFNQSFYQKLNGILTITPVVGNVANEPVNTTLLNAAYRIWQEYEPETFPGSDNVDCYALFAFDATWTLIQSLKQLCSTMDNNSSSCLSFTNTSYCFDRSFLNSRSWFDIIDNSAFLGVSGVIQFSSNTTDRIKGNYYIAKNLQNPSNNLNYVPVLAWSDSNGWASNSQTNVIVWPGNTLIPPSGYASLAGVTLRIVVTETDPFTMVTKETDIFGKTTTKLVGYIPDLISLLQSNMGFIPNITLVNDKTFDQLVDSVADNDYDMFVAQTTMTAARREKVDFSNAILDNSLRIIMRKLPTPNVDFSSYLRPFSFHLWMALLAAVTYAGLLLSVLERQENATLRERSIISLISMCMWYSLGSLVGYGVDFHVTTAAGRLITLGLYILSLISAAAYTANLASDIMISKTSNIISGIDDIKNGELSFSRIGILVGTSIEDYYLQEISGGVRNFYPLQSQKQMYDCLLNKTIDASIMDGSLLEYAINNVYCNLTLVGSNFNRSPFGIVLQKNWQYEQKLDVSILALRESGNLDSLKNTWFQATYCSQSSQQSTALTIESMAGLYLTFGIITILAVLLFIWTKRFIVKDYVLTLIRQKNVLNNTNVSIAKNSIGTSSANM